MMTITCEIEVSVRRTHSSRSSLSRRWQERTSACNLYLDSFDFDDDQYIAVMVWFEMIKDTILERDY